MGRKQIKWVGTNVAGEILGKLPAPLAEKIRDSKNPHNLAAKALSSLAHIDKAIANGENKGGEAAKKAALERREKLDAGVTSVLKEQRKESPKPALTGDVEREPSEQQRVDVWEQRP